ncbi:MAG: Gfo/Idh/MocA family oxidoreductase [Victivallales bacterium]|nr:Gfo/Idh/MocA family oxidoreductase [Victivallales bacterium]
MENPKICIVGAGYLSSRRIYPYIATAGGKLVGVCDLEQEKAARNANLYGGNVYNDIEQMIDEEKPDGVIICIGPNQHAKLAKVVMAKGIPVYTEKPAAPNAAEALNVAKYAKESGILCTTAFKKRYNIAYNHAKEWISKFPVNDLYSLSIDYASAQYLNDSDRRSFLLDFCVHIIDLSAYLFGDADEVFAFSKGMDAYAVSIKFKNGAVGSLNLNCGRSFQVPTEEVEISIKGGNFMTIHNSSSWKTSENGKPVEWREPPIFTSAGDSGNETGHLAEIIDFFNAIKEKRNTTRSNIYESYKTMVLYDAIKKSSETSEIIKIKYENL